MKKVILSILCAFMLFSLAAGSLSVSAASKNTVTTSIAKVESKAKGFKVTWKKKSKITGYQIQYSTSSKFKKAETKTITKAKTTSATISKLKGCNKKYYVRVRTYKIVKKKKVYSSWSKAKGVTTLNHKYSKATCTKAKTCKYCNKTNGKATGHKWAAATCTKAKSCSVCKVTNGKALGHKWTAATCTTAKTCKTCRKIEGKISNNAHSWGNWTVEKQPTANTEGLKSRKCFSCKKTEHAIIEPLLKYNLMSNGEYAVAGFSGASYDNLVIPETFKEKKITVIAAEAFSEQNIKSLTVSKNIYKIENRAFKGCKNLSETINISAVRNLAPDAFDDCTKLLITIPSSITTNLTLSDTKKIYVLKSDVQIKSTATLTFNEGIIFNGADYYIKNYGSFIATGSENNRINFYNVRLLSCNTNYTPNTFSLQYVNYYSGSLFYPTGDESHSDIFINNCSFYDCVEREYTYIWYPVACRIKNSYFENWSVLSVGANENATVLIEDNMFVNCGSDLNYEENYKSVIMCWAAYGDAIQVKNNTFINPLCYALSLRYDGRIDSIGNDFRVSKDKIHELIYDGNDDFSISNSINIS